MAVATRTTRGAAARRPVARRQARALFHPGGPTLEESISRTWRRLVSEASAACPVCGGGLHAGSPCGDCGSQLS